MSNDAAWEVHRWQRQRIKKTYHATDHSKTTTQEQRNMQDFSYMHLLGRIHYDLEGKFELQIFYLDLKLNLHCKQNN